MLFDTAAALHDLKRKGNSRTDPYISLNLMHGPDEALFTDEIFTKLKKF